MFILPSTAVSAASAIGVATSVVNASGIPSSKVTLPALSDVASLVADVATGAVYEATNASERWPTASLAKLMSATIVLDKLNPGTKITITESMLATDPTEFTLAVGDTYTVSDLLHLDASSFLKRRCGSGRGVLWTGRVHGGDERARGGVGNGEYAF